MAFELSLEELIDKVGNLNPGTALDKYIAEAVFPNFKNIEPGSKITFDYPLTFLVGANGSGKSSILQALWGMPFNYSTSRFWFSTTLDPIKEGGAQGINRYWYSHWISQLKKKVQTKKVRGRRNGGYWEPARAMVNDGMQAMPPLVSTDEAFRAKDRWQPTRRKVTYINFKCEISAFDRLLYFAPKKMTIDQRQALLRKGSEKLSSVIAKKLVSYKPGGKEAVFENKELNPEELKYVSYILGREYQSATYVLHRLYGDMEAPSVLFQRANMTYSDAFAGSGELAVVRVVMEILACEDNCLVLLDEPETSLHPGAQERLLCFLLEQVIRKRIQIVASTHAPSLIEKFPARAIKAMEEAPSGKMIVVDVTHPQVAFNRLGVTGANQILITVEDDLLAALVEIAMIGLDPGERGAIKIYIPPAGADDVFKNLIPLWMHEGRDCYVILDGDKNFNHSLPVTSSLSQAESKKVYPNLVSTIGCKPAYLDKDDVDKTLKYIDWIQDRVFYLEVVCPEYVLLEALSGKSQPSALTNQQSKDLLNEQLAQLHLEAGALAKRTIAKTTITPLRNTNPHIVALQDSLRQIIHRHGGS